MTKFGVVFLLVLLICGVLAITQPRATAGEAADPGVAANGRLTALIGAMLVVLLVAIAVTTLYLPAFLDAHYLVGLLLVPPVLLKVATTGYRFGRYYTGSPAYRLAGPPPELLRWFVAPALVASAVAVFATGIELWLFGLRFGFAWRSLHTISAVIFVLAAGAHMVGHLRQSADAVGDEARVKSNREVFTRRSAVVASLLLGLVLAAASLLYVSPFPSAIAG